MELIYHNINKYFGEHHVLKDISFNVRSGHIFGYLGRNGAGKTTSIRILMDVFKASSGEILIDGEVFDVSKYRIGYLPEERGMYAKSKVKDQLTYFAMLRGATKEEAQTSISYWAEKFEITEYLDRALETLSKGNQQKVQITQAFLNEPDILILDEPFSGLDPVNSKVFQDALNEYKSQEKIIVFSSHQMSYVESICDDIAIINQGEIVLKGSLNEIKENLGNRKVRLVSESHDEKTLTQILEAWGLSVSSDKTSLILELTEEMTKTSLLQRLIDNGVTIKMIDDYKPTLLDIFVGKVGAENV